MEVVSAQEFNAEPGMLDESLDAFKTNEEKRARGLLNLVGVGTIDGKPAKLQAYRPEYVHQEYPRMVYHADGRDMIVDDAEEHEIMRQNGFRDRPWDKPRVAVADPGVEKKILQDKLQQKDGEIAILTEGVAELRDTVEQLMKMQAKTHMMVKGKAAKAEADAE